VRDFVGVHLPWKLFSDLAQYPGLFIGFGSLELSNGVYLLFVYLNLETK